MAAQELKKVGIVGASGYAGAELLALLLEHPFVEISFITGYAQAGKKLADVYPQFNGFCDLRFESHEDFLKLMVNNPVDILFFALPHGLSQNYIPLIDSEVKVIDLGADYRLRSKDDYLKFYGKKHIDPDGLKSFTYGLADIFPDRIAASSRIASPGCFATAVQIGLIPLLSEDFTDGRIIVDAKTGSSGSGASPTLGTHHPFRQTSFTAYKVFSHQHRGEILQTFGDFNLSDPDNFILQTHSSPLVRGIFASCYCPLRSGITPTDVQEAFSRYYDKSRFVRLVASSPNTNTVQNSNFADVSVHINGNLAIVLVAIDNLVKGAAGQAVQNLNLVQNWKEDLGLRRVGGYP